MTDPLNTTDTDAYPGEGGLNSSDTQDWADPKIARTFRLLALVILPSLFVVIAVAALWWALTHPRKPDGLTPIVAASSPATDKDAQIAQLQNQLSALQGRLTQTPVTAVTPTTAPAPVYSADPSALARLSARVDQLEANQRVLAKAAASAYAARALQLAAKEPTPFLSELAVVEPSLDDPSLIGTLRPYAEKGVPSEVSLAVVFPSMAAKANLAAKAASGPDTLLNRVKHLFNFISVRRTDNYNGQGTEAILLRAETSLNNGNLKGAVAILKTLPAPAQKAISPWLDQANARVFVDETTRHISETALNRLSQMSGPQSTLTEGGAL